MPSLEGADAWLDRAEEHLRDLKALCGSLADMECNAIITDMGLNPPDDLQSSSFGDVRAPIRVSVLIGETIQALRRSLDYLVYEVAWLDSGSIQDDTQFPIDNHPDTFERRRKRRSARDHSCYLIGVSDEHAAALQLLQPFKGTTWTKTLGTLSNPDKHRHLAIARHTASSTTTEMSPITTAHIKLTGPARRTITRVAPDTVAVLIEFLPPNEMRVQFHITPYVAFDDRLVVVEVLEYLKAEVAGVLQEFKPCFGGKCHH